MFMKQRTFIILIENELLFPIERKCCSPLNPVHIYASHFSCIGFNSYINCVEKHKISIAMIRPEVYQAMGRGQGAKVMFV